eukprot:2663953-Pyramimonas_sp.AAC.1
MRRAPKAWRNCQDMFSSSMLCSSAAQASSVVSSRVTPRRRGARSSFEPPETPRGLFYRGVTRGAATKEAIFLASGEAAGPPLSRRHAWRHDRRCCETFTQPFTQMEMYTEKIWLYSSKTDRRISPMLTHAMRVSLFL